MLQEIQKWSIRTIKEFNGLSTTRIQYALYKDSSEKIIEMDIIELRKLKEFFDEWQDPFQIGNPLHSDKMK